MQIAGGSQPMSAKTQFAAIGSRRVSSWVWPTSPENYYRLVAECQPLMAWLRGRGGRI